MKKIVLLVLSFFVVIGLSGCSNNDYYKIDNKEENTKAEVLDAVIYFFKEYSEIEYQKNFDVMSSLESDFEDQDSFTPEEFSDYLSEDNTVVQAKIPFMNGYWFESGYFINLIDSCEEFVEGEMCETTYDLMETSLKVTVNDSKIVIFVETDLFILQFMFDIIDDEIRIVGYRDGSFDGVERYTITDYYQNHYLKEIYSSYDLEDDSYHIRYLDQNKDNQTFVQFMITDDPTGNSYYYEYYDEEDDAVYGYDVENNNYHLIEVGLYRDSNNVVNVIEYDTFADVYYNLAYVGGWTELVDREIGHGSRVYNGTDELHSQVPSVVLREYVDNRTILTLSTSDVSLEEYSLLSPITPEEIITLLEQAPNEPKIVNELFFAENDQEKFDEFIEMVETYLVET